MINVHIAPENPPAKNILIGVNSPGKILVIAVLPKPVTVEIIVQITVTGSHLRICNLCYRSRKKREQNLE